MIRSTIKRLFCLDYNQMKTVKAKFMPEMEILRKDVQVKNPDVVYQFSENFGEKCNKKYYQMPISKQKRMRLLQNEFEKYKDNVIDISHKNLKGEKDQE